MHPIIILWAHPRSMSTAIERVMRERGDLHCLHEPFLHYYYLQRSDKTLAYFDSEQDHPRSYAATREFILQQAKQAPVFAKDMSYYVIPELLEDVEFCRRLRHCFLIRNPFRSIMSYYKLDAELRLDEIGIEAQWRHFDGLRRLGIDDSLVLEAEAVQADPETAMSRFWQALGLEFDKQALSWEPESPPADWQYVQGWHRSVSDSRQIRASTAQDGRQAELEFEALCKAAPRLKEYLSHHEAFYHRLKAHSLTRDRHGN